MNAIKVVEAYERAFRYEYERATGQTPLWWTEVTALAREAVYLEIIENLMGSKSTLQ